MNDGQALLKAVLDEPDDDLPRLAFADWCDERGDDARAEFIRVQIERCRLPTWDERQSALAARERRLLTRHGLSWVPDVDGPAYGFTRGFAQSVAASFGALKKVAHPLEAIQPISEVMAWRTATREEGTLAWLAECPLWGGVHTLRASASPDAPGRLADFVRLCGGEHLTRLRRLCLGDLLVPESADELRGLLALPSLRGLERLEAGWVRLPYAGLASLAGALTALRAVSFRTADRPGPETMARIFTDAGLRGWRLWVAQHDWGEALRDHMTENFNRGGVRSLHVGHGGMLAALLDMPSWGELQALTLTLSGRQPEDWEGRLARHPGFAGLRSLRVEMPDSMQGPRLGLFTTASPALEELTVRCQPWHAFNVGMGPLYALRSPDRFPRLYTLDISLGDISSDELVGILASPGAAKLRRLRLNSSGLRREAVEAIARAALPSLNEVVVQSEDAAPPGLVEAFLRNEGMPNLMAFELWMRPDGKYPRGLIDECLASGRLCWVVGRWYDGYPDRQVERFRTRFWTPGDRLKVIEPGDEAT
jgi:uncharacterized protein (TIGR02996 family)